MGHPEIHVVPSELQNPFAFHCLLYLFWICFHFYLWSASLCLHESTHQEVNRTLSFYTMTSDTWLVLGPTGSWVSFV